MTGDLKRSLTVSGHRTSLSLEPEFWAALSDAARQEGKSVTALVSAIDQSRGERNLSSTIRTWLLARARDGLLRR
jgi:predicted DNA-binding ribbon-helix-helix protein